MSLLRNLSLAPGLLRLVQGLGLAGLIALLAWSVDWRAALSLMAGADPLWLGLAVLVLTVQTVLSAMRWRLTAARLGIIIPMWEAVREYYLSQVVNQSLPGGVVGDANRALRAKAQAGLIASGQAVVFERIAGQLGLLAILLLGFMGAVLLPGEVRWPMALMIPVAAALALAIVLPTGILVALRLSGYPETALRAARRFGHAVLAPAVAPRQIGLSLATALCNVGAFALCAVALGVALPIGVSLVLVPLILFAMVLPLSISGWGLREGAAAALFPLAGATAAEGLATSVAFGLVFLATVLPGLLVTWLRPNAPVLEHPSATINQ